MCGGDLKAEAEETIGTCDHCGSTMTLPKISDDRKANLFNRITEGTVRTDPLTPYKMGTVGYSIF